MDKDCNVHGLTSHIYTHNGKGHYTYRCRRCRNEAVVRKRQALKLQAIEYKGGKCVRCGYDKCPGALDFHHVTEDKDFDISKSGNTRAWDKIKVELDKCILLCANCHREEHWLVSNR